MCNFFSLASNSRGKIYYFNAKLRKKILNGELGHYQADSHTSIADYYGYKGAKEDQLNKYEYNPLTQEFVVDQLNTLDDSENVEKFCRKLDFKTIVPELRIHKIINPFKDRNCKTITSSDIQLLKQWDSVRDSVRYSVRDSVWAFVGDSVWDSVWASVWDSVRDSVRYSVRDSVRDSVGASVWAYTSSFFQLKTWKYIEHKRGSNPYASVIKLWNRGIVPSFDGKTWRLHGNKNAGVMFSITAKKLKNLK